MKIARSISTFILLISSLAACAPVSAQATAVATFTKTPIALIRPTETVTFAPTETYPHPPTSTQHPTGTVPPTPNGTQTKYTAIITSGEAQFWFAIDPTIQEWPWHLAPANRIEYQWEAIFPCLDIVDHQTVFDCAAAVTQIESDPHKPPHQKGTFQDLLNACETGVWMGTPDRSWYSLPYYDNQITSTYLKGWLLIELNAPDLLSYLDQTRPQYVTFVAISYSGMFPMRKMTVKVSYP